MGLCDNCALKYADCKGNKDLEKCKCDYHKKPVVMNVKELAERVAELELIADKYRWIPVEEEPPQFPCLVCDANVNQPFVPMGIVTITDEEHGEWHIDGRLWDTPKVFVDGEWGNQLVYGNRIIAWMPLPEPYKEV